MEWHLVQFCCANRNYCSKGTTSKVFFTYLLISNIGWATFHLKCSHFTLRPSYLRCSWYQNILINIEIIALTTQICKDKPQRLCGQRWMIRIPRTHPTIIKTYSFTFCRFNTVASIATATNFEEFRAAFVDYVAPAQNFIFADTAGNIGYQCPGLIPARYLSSAFRLP